MAVIPSIAGSLIGTFTDHPYWAVRLYPGKSYPDHPVRDIEWMCELDPNLSSLNRTSPHYDWTFDLITTGDILRIAELWMFCPKNPLSPNGNTATLHFTPEEVGTAFLFNVAQTSLYGRYDHRIIGKVTDRLNGDCVCFIWDDELQVMSTPWHSNIYHFGTWRPGVPGKTGGVAPIAALNHEIIGLQL